MCFRSSSWLDLEASALDHSTSLLVQTVVERFRQRIEGPSQHKQVGCRWEPLASFPGGNKAPAVSDQSSEPSLAQSCLHPIRAYSVGNQDGPAATPPRQLERHAVIVERENSYVREEDVSSVRRCCGYLSVAASRHPDFQERRADPP